ncbi:MAG: hypothetical protein PHW63_03065 [Alphaproteobacteria bacterium]|nr:hypothetical protein [Alphaproteobacteria bacterium]
MKSQLYLPFLLGVLGVLVSPSWAQEQNASFVKDCPKVTVLWFEGSSVFDKDHPRRKYIFFTDPSPRLDVLQVGQAFTLKASGPSLGVMDGLSASPEWVCTDDGIEMKAEISRSKNYNGSTLYNPGTWYPEITAEMALRDADAVVHTTWSMKLDDGAVLSRATTPPYGEQTYPVTLRAALRQNR